MPVRRLTVMLPIFSILSQCPTKEMQAIFSGSGQMGAIQVLALPHIPIPATTAIGINT
jgi:hypothetical protein